MPGNAPPGRPLLVAAETLAEAESAVISPSKSETFAAPLAAVAVAAVAACACACARIAPVTTTEPSAG